MSNIGVSVSKNPKRQSVFIDPLRRASDDFNQDTGETKESDNILATGVTSRDALAKFYGKN